MLSEISLDVATKSEQRKTRRQKNKERMRKLRSKASSPPSKSSLPESSEHLKESSDSDTIDLLLKCFSYPILVALQYFQF